MFIEKFVGNPSGELFVAQTGITFEQVKQLIAFTQTETDLVKLDGDEERFMSLDQYFVWKNKGRTIHVLHDAEDNLRGVFWAGQKDLPSRPDYTKELDPSLYNHTYAFRLYDTARGQRLSHPVLTACLMSIVNSQPKPVGWWIEVSGANLPALGMDMKQGFEIVSGNDKNNRLIMARTYA